MKHSKRTGYCKKCKMKLMIPSWIWCRKCSPDLRKKQINVEQSIVNSSLYGSLNFLCDREKALQSDTLIYDENMDIIGYRKPMFTLKEKSFEQTS